MKSHNKICQWCVNSGGPSHVPAERGPRDHGHTNGHATCVYCSTLHQQYFQHGTVHESYYRRLHESLHDPDRPCGLSQAAGCASGVYFARLHAGNQTSMIRMMLMK